MRTERATPNASALVPTDRYRGRQRAVLDALHDGPGQLSVEDLARAVDGCVSWGERAQNDEAIDQRELLAHVLPPLVAAGDVAFSPERRTVSLASTSRSSERSMGSKLLVGAVTVASIATVAAGVRWSPLASLGVVGLSLLPLTYLASRGGSSVRVLGSSRSLDSAGVATPAVDRGDAGVTGPDPEQRILALLLATGGRMRQQAIVARLGLAESTASRHISSLAEDDLVAKASIGRENLVCLPSAHPGDERGPRPATGG